MSALHLVVPGLLEATDDGPGCPLPRHLRRLFRGRAVAFPGGSGPEVLGRLFGIEQGPLPHAALSRLGADLPTGERYWFHADLVHLYVDMDRLILVGEGLEVSPEEARALFARFAGHFAERGWVWEPGRGGRGWLGLSQAPRVETHPLDRVQGRAVHPFLPSGPEGRPWRALLNEAQMALHDAPENAAREARGRPTVNGLWLWGGGRLPTRVSWRRFEAVWGAGDLLAGLLRASGSEAASGAPGAGPDRGDALCYLDALWQSSVRADTEAWRQAVLDLDVTVARMPPWGRLYLYPCNGRRWCYRPSDRWRWWRRPPPCPADFTARRTP